MNDRSDYLKFINLHGRHAVFCLIAFLCLPECLQAQSKAQSTAQSSAQFREDAPIIKYRTREEKREAGLNTALTSWLSFQGVAESEVIRETLRYQDNIPDHKADFIDPAIQFNFEVGLEDFEAEIILEYTEDNTDPLMEELIMSWDIGNVGLTAGRYYVPFGEYFSNFINGPLIEFSQTRGDALQIDYDFNDVFEIAAYIFEAKSDHRMGRSISDNWGVSFEAKFHDDHVLVGGGWLSNLADGEFRPLEDHGDLYEQRVSAWNLYIIMEWDSIGFSLEQVKARGGFAELDDAENSPSAWNLEAAWYPSRTTEFALRFEEGKELADEAEKQTGIQFTWRPLNRLNFSIEYIRQKFRQDFVFDDDETELESGHLLAGSFSYIF